MPSTIPDARTRADACPGVLTLHEAADGLLARVRLPGGAASAGQFAALASAAADFGSGGLELTSRANVQLRGIAPHAQPELQARLAAAGLLPSATHERVRNIIATPLSGIDGVHREVGTLVAELDGELCDRPELAQLPGRFLFAVDDGRGDVAALGADITIVRDGAGAMVESVEMPVERAVPFALELASAFLDVRRAQGSRAWRVRELDGGVGAVLAAIGIPPPARCCALPAQTGQVGLVAQPDGLSALVAGVPFGSVTATQLAFLSAIIGTRGIRFTPWRSVVIPDLDGAAEAAEAAGRAGFAVDEASPWLRVSACTGRPGCSSALADVRADAVARLADWPGQHVRWSGCARRCGRPSGTDVDVVATPDGYDVTVAGS